ncbi:unnamed protein product [Gongylonema pulchrum]|uniref:G-patch domain-containing protein n=1 Tax=Gongylonema pulchrum TaxID=637853 RepID=A0A183EZV6_9BILA|nr:unnamed protein product [Gongylonema pulchrum]
MHPVISVGGNQDMAVQSRTNHQQGLKKIDGYRAIGGLGFETGESLSIGATKANRQRLIDQRPPVYLGQSSEKKTSRAHLKSFKLC